GEVAGNSATQLVAASVKTSSPVFTAL
ncbi:MAG: hypothetical protein ACI9U2_001467, partial [Bradymonadia bacterium]